MCGKPLQHEKYYNKLRREFSSKFLYDLEPMRRTSLLEKHRLQKIDNFFEIVMPSLMSKCFNQHFVCFFPECLRRKFNQFTSSKNHIAHIVECHSHQIPGRGEYLWPLASPDQHCEDCLDDMNLVFSESMSKRFEQLAITYKTLPLAIKFTDEWHLYGDSMPYSQSFDEYEMTDDSVYNWFSQESPVFNRMKRELSSISFTNLKKK